MSLGAARIINSITDLSMFVDNVLLGWVVLVGQFERGPVGKATAVSSLDELRTYFGNKVPWTTDPLVAEMGLRQGARFIIIRVVHYEDVADVTSISAYCSTLTLNDMGAIATHGKALSTYGPYAFIPSAGGNVTGDEIGPFNIATGVNDSLKFQVAAGTAVTVTLAAASLIAAQVIIDQINNQAGSAGLTAHVVGNQQIKIAANSATNSLSLLDVATDAYSTLGLIEGTYKAVPGTNVLDVKINAQATPQSFTLLPLHGETGVYNLTSSQVVSQLSGLVNAVAFSINGRVCIETVSAGSSTGVQIMATSTCLPQMGWDTNVHAGNIGSSQPTLRVDASNPGQWSNNLIFQVWPSALNPDTAVTIKVVLPTQGLTETYTDMDMDPTSQNYAPNFINSRSQFVVLTDLASSSEIPQNRPLTNVLGYQLTGGADGGAMQDSDWIGDPLAQTGFYAADQTWNPAMDIIVPSTQSPNVYQALIVYVETRADLIAYGEIPYGMTPAEAINWRNGIGFGFGAWNSHRFCLFYGRPLVFDDMDNTTKYISCLGHLASCLAKTDNNYDQSYAPVGPKRGTVTLCDGVDFDVRSYNSTGYPDLFANNGINYLFISHIPGIQGAMFWEQRTTWQAESALQDLNVVRFITAANRMLLPVLETFLFDPNHPMTWRAIARVLEPAFQAFKNKYQIYDFVIQTDKDAYWDGKGNLINAVINTGLDISQHIYHCRALIQPTQAIYYLMFDMGVVGAGVAFEQFTSLYQLPGWNVT